MSSTYRALCLNHDPAIDTGHEWHHPDSAIYAVAHRDTEALGDHAGCDLLIARYSGALIEIACPPHSIHRDPRWVGAEWLRLAALCVGFVDSDFQGVFKSLTRICWTKERLLRLRPHLFTD